MSHKYQQRILDLAQIFVIRSKNISIPSFGVQPSFVSLAWCCAVQAKYHIYRIKCVFVFIPCKHKHWIVNVYLAHISFTQFWISAWIFSNEFRFPCFWCWPIHLLILLISIYVPNKQQSKMHIFLGRGLWSYDLICHEYFQTPFWIYIKRSCLIILQYCTMFRTNACYFGH